MNIRKKPKWRTDKKTGIRSYRENGIVFVEADLTNDDGMGLIYDDVPFVFLRKGISDRQARLVKAKMRGELYLGFAGAWKFGGIEDRRDVPQQQKTEEVNVMAAQLLCMQ